MENNNDHEGSLGTDRNPPSGTNYKDKQQSLTELNADGNTDRGEEGETLASREEALKKRIEELRKRDPFIYK